MLKRYDEARARAAHIKEHLNTQARKHEAVYPDNPQFSIKPNGDLWLARLKAKDPVPGVDELTEMIKRRMPKRNSLDIIVDTQKTLNWGKPFGPISGFESQIKDPSMSYAVTTFCYGCHLGPMQTELTFYDFPAEHWLHIQMTNPIESTFATVRLRTNKVRGCFSANTVLTMAFNYASVLRKDGSDCIGPSAWLKL